MKARLAQLDTKQELIVLQKQFEQEKEDMTSSVKKLESTI